MMEVHNGSAADSLDRIRTGGLNLILTAQQRLAEIKRALDAGRFGEAFTVGNSLQEKLGHLAAAQAALGRVAETSMIRVRDAEPGMTVLDAGVLAEISPCEECEREQCANVTLKFENGHQVTLERDDELVISQGSD